MKPIIPVTTISLPRPTPGQTAILNHPGSAVVFAGRRFGKTQIGVYRLLRAATAQVGLYWWVGLSWRSASMKRAWRLLKYYARKMWAATGERADKRIREAEREIYLPNGSSIWLRTAENEDSLTGEAVRGMVVDEFSLMREPVWTEFLEAALLDYEGSWALFIGVPKGENWSAALWRNAASREGWRQFHYTTYDNPHMKRARIDAIRANVPERIWQQEYMAAILPDGGAVFRLVRQAASATSADRLQSGHEYVIGVDLAKLHDWTVFSVMDKTTRELVYLDRFQQVNYVLQLDRLMALAERFQPKITIVERNIGEMFIEEAQRRGLRVEPFMTTSATKQTLIEHLALAFERNDIAILPDPVLIGELEAFSMERLPSGLLRYSAPAGMHDDCVISLALAWHACHTTREARVHDRNPFFDE